MAFINGIDRTKRRQRYAMKKIRLLRGNLIFCLTGLLLVPGLKCYYRQADCDSLLWILAPTARWVEFLSGISFTYISGAGYVNHSLRMVIAASHRKPVLEASRPDARAATGRRVMRTWARGFGWIAASAFVSWLLIVFVNGLRIIIAVYLPIYLEDAGLMGGMLTQNRLHTMIGVVVYFTALLTIYRLAGWFVQGAVRPVRTPLSLQRKCAPPVFWYLAFTLGFPPLNRIGRAGTGEFAGKKAVADIDGCLVPGDFIELRVNLGFRNRVKGSGRLIQDDKGRVLVQCAGNGDLLCLVSRDVYAVFVIIFLQIRFQSIWHFCQSFLKSGLVQGICHPVTVISGL